MASATKNYAYRLGSPTTGTDIVHEQLRRASDYRNKLVEIELRRRAAVDAVLREMCPGLVECEQRLAQVQAQIQDVIDQQRGRNQRARGLTDDAAFRCRLDQLQPERKALAAERRRLRKEDFEREDTKEALRVVDDAAKAEIKEARAASGLYWGTYLLVEQAADSFRRGAPPVYRRYRGEGRIGVQIQHGMTWSEAFNASDTRLRLVHTPRTEPIVAANGKTLPPPGSTKQSQQYTLWLRVGSDGRDAVWAKWPLRLHRYNANTRIMWAVVRRMTVAGKERWGLTVTLRDDVGGRAFAREDVARDGTVGIDIGYRIMTDGRQRIAYWTGSDGLSGELSVPADTVAQWAKVEDLQSIRDDIHNDAKALLRDWLREHEAPEWLTTCVSGMHAWKNPSRLDKVVLRWHSTRFAGDDQVYQLLEAWRSRERHLWQYQGNLRDQLAAARKDRYRNWAAGMRRKYRTFAVEDIDLRSAIHDVMRDDVDRETVTAQRRVARFAGLSVLMQALSDCGADVVTVTRAGTTEVCNWCGESNEIDARLMHQCQGCGRRWDRDANASRNILARGEAGQDSREPLAPQSPPENGRRNKMSRSERLATARKQ